jgi:TPR repeat protein
MPPALSAAKGGYPIEANQGAAAANAISTAGAGAAVRVQGCADNRAAARKLAPNEIAGLLKRGREFMQNGNLAAARLVFQRAAEACDRDAAFALGGTYDPSMLQKLGIRPLTANIAVARAWYENARQLGSYEAAEQLGALIDTDRP